MCGYKNVACSETQVAWNFSWQAEKQRATFVHWTEVLKTYLHTYVLEKPNHYDVHTASANRNKMAKTTCNIFAVIRSLKELLMSVSENNSGLSQIMSPGPCFRSINIIFTNKP